MVHHRKRNGTVAVVMGLVWLATLTFSSKPVWGQTIGQLTINYIEASNLPGQLVNQVRAYATVSSADQSPVSELSLENFEVLEDGKPVTVDEVNEAMDPVAVILVIDTSGSMQARDKSGQTSMNAAKNAAIDFTATLSDEDSLAIYSFNKEPVLEMDFSTDREEAIRTLTNVTAETKAPTCLYDTAYQAVKKAAEIPMGRRAIILLTDGRDEKGGGTCSTYSANDVIDAATTKTLRVPIYTVGVGPKVDPQDLGRISKLTGGRNLIAKSISELNEFYQILANQLKNQYVIKYNSQTPSGEHSLVLKVSSQGEQGQDEKRFWLPPLPVLQPPEVSILSPSETDQIKGGGTVRVRVNITPEDTLAKVRYYVDAILKEEFNQAPFDIFEWNTTGLQTGLHIVRVEAIDIKGQTGYAEMTKKVKGPPPPKPEPAPAPVAKPAPKAEPLKPLPLVPIIAAIAVLLAIAGGGGWWLTRRKKAADAAAMAQAQVAEMPDDIEDETIFAVDFGEAAAAPLATLSVVESMVLEAGTTFELTGRVTVGRTDRNDINIPDKPVSRKHGEIYFEDNAYYIRDLRSRNGVRVDEKRVSGDGMLLNDGAEVRLGPKTILKFHCNALIEEAGFDDRTKRYDM